MTIGPRLHRMAMANRTRRVLLLLRRAKDKERQTADKEITTTVPLRKVEDRVAAIKVVAATAIVRKGRAAATKAAVAVIKAAVADTRIVRKVADRAAGRAQRAGREAVRRDSATIVRRLLPQARRRGQNRKTRTLHNLRWAAETVATLVGANIRAIIALGAVCLTGSKNAKKRRSPKTT